MRIHTIPRTDLAVSVLALGTVPLGSDINEKDSFLQLDTYVELGGNFVDSANVYADWKGLGKSTSEKTVGNWLKQAGNRSSIILSTKGAHPPLDNIEQSRMSPAEIQHDLDQSLGHLQTDYIDIYWLHRDAIEHPVEEIVESLEANVKAGKIRYYGGSNWSIERLDAARKYAEKQGYTGFVASQNLWSLAVPNKLGDPTLVITDAAERNYNLQTGFASVPYSSQANGFFSGRYSRDKVAEDGFHGGTVKAHYFNETNFGRLDRVEQLSREIGRSGTEIALAYLLSQPYPVFPIIGPRTIEQLTESCGATDLQLSAETLAFLEG